MKRLRGAHCRSNHGASASPPSAISADGLTGPEQTHGCFDARDLRRCRIGACERLLGRASTARSFLRHPTCLGEDAYEGARMAAWTTLLTCPSQPWSGNDTSIMIDHTASIMIDHSASIMIDHTTSTMIDRSASIMIALSSYLDHDLSYNLDRLYMLHRPHVWLAPLRH
jgi:hypothetical protein